MSGIYTRVEKLANDLGISIFELEKRAGLSNGTIGKWRYCSPRIENVARVAVALHVPIETLLRDDDEQE